MREPSRLLKTGLDKQAIWPGGDRALALSGLSGRSTSRVRARAAIREAPTLFGPECRIDTRLGSSPCVETARINLKHTPRFRLAAPRRTQNGACPGYGAILRGECALCVLDDLFWCPGTFMCIGSRAPAQVTHPSAVEALGVRNADLPGEWSLSTTPSPKPHGQRSTGARAERRR